MKAIYKINLKEKMKIDYKIKSMQIDNVNINWNFTHCNELESITLEMKNIPIYIDQDGYIFPQEYSRIEGKIYKIAVYIANNFYIQTGLDIIDSNSVLNSSPELFPESKEEKDIFDKNNKNEFVTINCETLLILPFIPEMCLAYKFSAAISNYADGLRIENVLLKYEQFYKVIEHFFYEKGDKLDEEVSSYAFQFNPIYTEEKIRRMRRLRNWCTHPKDLKRHINSENIEKVREVNEELKDIQDLAKLLIIRKEV